MARKKKSTPEEGSICVRGYAGFPFQLGLPLHPDIEQQLADGHLTRVANLDGDPYVAEEDAPAPPAGD